MTIFSTIAKSIAGNATTVSKSVPIGSVSTPSIPRTGASVPISAPIKVDVNANPVDLPNTKPIDPAKPATSGSSGTALLGVGIAGASLLPTLLNSSVVQGAIASGAQVGSIAIVADKVSEVANNLVTGITESPINMALFAVGTVAVLYFVMR